jgi:glycosyltransferase involved in cell wall biosynthesis
MARVPKVSVIISTYNRKDSLKRAIKSVLAQSFDDFELLVVDDCSTEDVKKLVTSFGDERVQYFRTDVNSGHDGKPKNIGIKHAEGEYVCFLDDDDFWRVDALKILLTYAVETGVEVTYGDYTVGGKIGWSMEFSAARLNQHNFIAMDTVCVKRDWLLKVGGFDENVPKFKDWNLWLRMHKMGARFMHVPIIVCEVAAVSKDSISEKFQNEKDEHGRYLPTWFNPADCLIFPEQTILGPRKPLKVAVYTMAMNRLDYTKRMFKALDKTAGYPFDWYVIDQGSTDGTGDWLKSLTRDRDEPSEMQWYAHLRYKIYEQNVGLAKGWNACINFIKKSEDGPYDIVIKVDNDAELMTDGWLAAMIDIFERNRRVCLSPYVEGLDGLPGGVLRQRASGDSPYMMINDYILGTVPHLGGICYATPIEIWDEFRFDEDAAPGNRDTILSNYANRNNYHLFYMEEFRVWHIDGSKGQSEKFPEYFKSKEDSKV